jgi:hypothetical protein
MLSTLKGLLGRLGRIEQQNKRIQEALGRIEARQVAELHPSQIADAEFRVYSQWGEDGILQHLLRLVPFSRKTFVEFGVENYTESNTRFLLTNNNWSGLVIDGSQKNIDFIKNDGIYWQHNLKAVQAFITRENINELLGSNGIKGEIGLLSVDIDGNDYWVWKAIDVVDAAIVVVEYNARFGAERAVTIPYQADFRRSPEKGAGIYYGASLSAFASLGHEKGYALVACNSAGNNAFFVKRDLLPTTIPELSPLEAFVRNQFREARGKSGRLLYLDEADELSLLKDLPLVEVF